MGLFIGLMSGTSTDGVDAVLADFDPAPRSIAHVHEPYADTLRAELLALNRSGPDELHRAARAANSVADAYAQAVHRLLVHAGIDADAVRALGAHGQTVRHRPAAPDHYTLQLLNGARLAEATGIDVVCDLRSRDVAAGGQGAPLVPAFHAACLSEPGRDVAVLNLGGIANLSLLFGDGRVLGFDTGPASALLDAWVQLHRGTAYDDRGDWAAGARVHAALLSALRSDPYFAAAPPKSTGRDHFDLAWLEAASHRLAAPIPPQQVQATLLELTATTIADALRPAMPRPARVWVCGGGTRNVALMRRLQALLAPASVETTSAAGIDPQQMEALAFAWLARACLARGPGNLPAVTGAAGPRVLGAIYPAG